MNYSRERKILWKFAILFCTTSVKALLNRLSNSNEFESFKSEISQTKKNTVCSFDEFSFAGFDSVLHSALTRITHWNWFLKLAKHFAKLDFIEKSSTLAQYLNQVLSQLFVFSCFHFADFRIFLFLLTFYSYIEKLDATNFLL